jgi:transposase
MGAHLSIDETALSQGELYTIITNKKAKGNDGAIVAILSGTKVGPIIEQVLKIPLTLRNIVTEITLDMAPTMKHIAKKCFPKAIQVTDRFHVQKLAIEALQDIRIKHRWDAIDQENQEIQQAKISFINQYTLTTMIPGNNYWPEVDFCCLNHQGTGAQNKPKEPLSYSNYIQTSRRPLGSYNSSGIYITKLLT